MHVILSFGRVRLTVSPNKHQKWRDLNEYFSEICKFVVLRCLWKKSFSVMMVWKGMKNCINPTYLSIWIADLQIPTQLCSQKSIIHKIVCKYFCLISLHCRTIWFGDWASLIEKWCTDFEKFHDFNQYSNFRLEINWFAPKVIIHKIYLQYFYLHFSAPSARSITLVLNSLWYSTPQARKILPWFPPWKHFVSKWMRRRRGPKILEGRGVLWRARAPTHWFCPPIFR